MNIENLNKAIAVMTRAGKIDMGRWQNTTVGISSTENETDTVKETEEEIHSCGTAACFAGWIGVSPEWKEFGGVIDGDGEPVLGKLSACKALSLWLDLPEFFIEMLMFATYGQIYGDMDEDYKLVYSIYGVPFTKVEAGDIVNTLTRVKNLGFKEFIKVEIAALDLLKQTDRVKNLLSIYKNM